VLSVRCLACLAVVCRVGIAHRRCRIGCMVSTLGRILERCSIAGIVQLLCFLRFVAVVFACAAPECLGSGVLGHGVLSLFSAGGCPFLACTSSSRVHSKFSLFVLCGECRLHLGIFGGEVCRGAGVRIRLCCPRLRSLV